MYIKIEYSQNSGHFHFSRIGEKGENSNDYQTLTPKIDAEQAEQFCESLKLKFPGHNCGRPDGNLSFAKVQEAFLDYVSEQIKLMRSRMEESSQHRKTVMGKD